MGPLRAHCASCLERPPATVNTRSRPVSSAPSLCAERVSKPERSERRDFRQRHGDSLGSRRPRRGSFGERRCRVATPDRAGYPFTCCLLLCFLPQLTALSERATLPPAQTFDDADLSTVSDNGAHGEAAISTLSLSVCVSKALIPGPFPAGFFMTTAMTSLFQTRGRCRGVPAPKGAQNNQKWWAFHPACLLRHFPGCQDCFFRQAVLSCRQPLLHHRRHRSPQRQLPAGRRGLQAGRSVAQRHPDGGLPAGQRDRRVRSAEADGPPSHAVAVVQDLLSPGTPAASHPPASRFHFSPAAVPVRLLAGVRPRGPAATPFSCSRVSRTSDSQPACAQRADGSCAALTRAAAAPTRCHRRGRAFSKTAARRLLLLLACALISLSQVPVSAGFGRESRELGQFRRSGAERSSELTLRIAPVAAHRQDAPQIRLWRRCRLFQFVSEVCVRLAVCCTRAETHRWCQSL